MSAFMTVLGQKRAAFKETNLSGARNQAHLKQRSAGRMKWGLGQETDQNTCLLPPPSLFLFLSCVSARALDILVVVVLQVNRLLLSLRMAVHHFIVSEHDRTVLLTLFLKQVFLFN